MYSLHLRDLVVRRVRDFDDGTTGGPAAVSRIVRGVTVVRVASSELVELILLCRGYPEKKKTRATSMQPEIIQDDNRIPVAHPWRRNRATHRLSPDHRDSPVNLAFVRELGHIHPFGQVEIQEKYRGAQDTEGAARQHLAEETPLMMTQSIVRPLSAEKIAPHSLEAAGRVSS